MLYYPTSPFTALLLFSLDISKQQKYGMFFSSRDHTKIYQVIAASNLHIFRSVDSQHPGICFIQLKQSYQMGCISSKAITRSMSIREELSHGFQSTTSAWEELLTSHSGNDQLFAFVCSSNNISTKLRTSSFTLPSRDPETAVETKYLANAWDLISDVNGKTEVESAPDFSRFTRSKSCQMPKEREMLWQSPELNDNKLDKNDKNLIGSRSFHTVEEYDALLERIHKFSTRSIESFEDYYSSNSVDEHQKTSKDSVKKNSGIEDQELDLDQEGCDSLINCENVVGGDGRRENGWKRKAVAKGLKSLDVPTVEFPAVARLRQRIHEGRVCSPGTYVTPKFGSYNAAAMLEKERRENMIFSPELVAAFEDSMLDLQVEEESILREMDGYFPVDDEMENEAVELS